tara:strand:- start:962 stop:1078 length:117 start_codon:yes stop_codon:yes gene_type:complete
LGLFGLFDIRLIDLGVIFPLGPPVEAGSHDAHLARSPS